MIDAMEHDKQLIAARYALSALLEAYRFDGMGAMIAAARFIDEYSAGYPDMPLFAEKVRFEATYWADTAAPHELEAYTVAAIGALADSPLLDRQLRKLAALAYGRMSPETKAKFLEWAQKDE